MTEENSSFSCPPIEQIGIVGVGDVPLGLIRNQLKDSTEDGRKRVTRHGP